LSKKRCVAPSVAAWHASRCWSRQASTQRPLAAPLARVSAAQYGRLWSAIADALDDEFFGQDSHPMRVAVSRCYLTRHWVRATAARR